MALEDMGSSVLTPRRAISMLQGPRGGSCRVGKQKDEMLLRKFNPGSMYSTRAQFQPTQISASISVNRQMMASLVAPFTCRGRRRCVWTRTRAPYGFVQRRP